MIAFRSHPASTDRLLLDPDALPARDRAVLRILARADVATASQLATLAYGRRRTAQDRLQRLWQTGLLERAPAPQHRAGTSPYAYRLSPAARRRLGIIDRRPAGPTLLRHTLDGVAVACALVAYDRHLDEPSLQAWLPERMLAGLDLGDTTPDGLLVLQAAGRSGVVCLEIDEGTQHAAVIRPRLETYARFLRDRPGWMLVVVVPSVVRAAWVARLARNLERRVDWLNGWTATHGDIERAGPTAPVIGLGPPDRRTTLASALPDDRPRRSIAPVASAAWLDLLAAGGGEALAEALRR